MDKPFNNVYTADFETNNHTDKCSVWAYSIVNVYDLVVEEVGTRIEDFITWCINNPGTIIYFHNLSFDGSFIIPYLIKNGFKWSDKGEPNTYETSIDNMGNWYRVTIRFDEGYNKKTKSKRKRINKVEIRDSAKKIPLPVADIPKAFGLKDISKGIIDYDTYREPGTPLADIDKEYVIDDSMIVAMALKQMYDEGMTGLTLASDCMKMYKETIGGNDRFRDIFPELPVRVDDFIRRAYRGGWVWLNPIYKNMHLSGLVFDVNSLYPWAMYTQLMPYGIPIKFYGEPEDNELYPLWICEVDIEFNIKKNGVPCIQLKNNNRFGETEYLLSSEGEIITMCVDSISWLLILENYDIDYIDFNVGYKFKGAHDLFKNYIDVNMKGKEESEGGRRFLFKRRLNGLYGKFATSPHRINKYPILDDGGLMHFTKCKDRVNKSYSENIEEKETEIIESPIYTAIGVFVTAYARRKTISTAQSLGDRFIYGDTDSVHIIGYEMPTNIEIHKSHIGAWKVEGLFIDSKYLRAKTYMELIADYNKDGEYSYNGFKWDIKCAGLSKEGKMAVTWDNFKEGASFSRNKLRTVNNGKVLEKTEFKIHCTPTPDYSENVHCDIIMGHDTI